MTETTTTTATETDAPTPVSQTITVTLLVNDHFQLTQEEGSVYSVSDPSVAEIDENGILFARKPGTVEVKVTLPSGDVTTYQITVEEEICLGDANLDGDITAEDAAQILIYAAAKGAGEETVLYSDDAALDAKAKRQADTNGDGIINAEDAANVLLYAALSGAEFKADWSEILGKSDETTA